MSHFCIACSSAFASSLSVRRALRYIETTSALCRCIGESVYHIYTDERDSFSMKRGECVEEADSFSMWRGESVSPLYKYEP